jgi:hypothetical protein
MDFWIRRNLLVLWILVTAAVTAGATGASDRDAILGAVHTLVDAWREANVMKAESVLHKDYRAESWQECAQGRYVFVETRDQLLAQIAKLRPGLWDVHLLSTMVNMDSNGLAVVWANYEFYFDGKADHCGHESYTLIHTPAGWKIINFADSDTPLRGRRTAMVCPK